MYLNKYFYLKSKKILKMYFQKYMVSTPVEISNGWHSGARCPLTVLRDDETWESRVTEDKFQRDLILYSPHKFYV